MTKQMLFGCALVGCLLVASPACAAEMLLVEIGWSQPAPVTLPADYTLWARTGPPVDNALWSNHVIAFPAIDSANALQISAFNRTLASGRGGEVAFFNAGQQLHEMAPFLPFDRIVGGADLDWSNGNSPYDELGFIGVAHVPQLGNSLYGYTITAMERTITAETQLVRIYGEANPIPEPATMLLAIMLAGASMTWRLF